MGSAMALKLTAAFSSADEFLCAFDEQISKSGLLVRGAALEGVQAMSPCELAVSVAAVSVAVAARVAAVVPGVGVAVVFDGVPPALAGLAQRLRPGEAEAPAEASGLVSERIKSLHASQKMALALSGSREERFHLLRDPNKTLHVFVLRNPRIGVDEVAWAAKQATLSPDALKMIAEHREWSANATVCVALVRNPKTPLPLALRLLDRIPMTEVRALAKGGARDQIVHAARKKVNPT
jgi:hypothetical protein